MNMRGRAFKGTPTTAATYQPVVTTPPHQTIGIPIGYELRTGRVVVYYPWSMPSNVTSTRLEGEPGSGKSTWLKTTTPKLMGTHPHDIWGRPRSISAPYNTR
jgi:hypothetical protein